MDRESESNFTEENSFSLISNDDILTRNVREDVANPYYQDPNNSFQRFGNNESFLPAGYPSRKLLLEQCLQLKEFLLYYSPDMMNVFQPDYEEVTGRKTPLHFSDCHMILQMNFPGVICQVTPNYLKNEGGIVSLSNMCYQNLDEIQIDDYPGPLSVEKTTEEQILSYLKDQMSIELQDTSPIDWDSGHLLLNFLELMIKENGKPKITSIVRLLNDGVETKTSDLRKDSKLFDTISRNSFSRASSRATSRASSRPVSPTNQEIIDPDLPGNDMDKFVSRGPGSVTGMVQRAAANASSDQRMCLNMDRYRQYIMTGRFEEAVHFAIKSGIWDHAFALALRINNMQLVNEVLVSFSRHAIYSNDPLYTMHELMAMKPPKIVVGNRGFSHNEMGDWRSHLGMILAVKKYRPEECRQAIEAMGEKLAALRSYYAAHLCYLLAGTQFGLDKTSTRYRRKFDLIGWSSSTNSIPAQKSTAALCSKLFTGIRYWKSAPEQCIKLTEIYEYALKLSPENCLKTVSVHLLSYKYIMACKMLSQNQVISAYEYCMDFGEVLGYSDIDWLKCDSINFQMISNIRNISIKLNYKFANLELYSESNVSWLSNIDSVYHKFCEKLNIPTVSLYGKPDFFLPETQNDSHLYNSDNVNASFNGIPSDNYPESIASSAFIDHQQLQQHHQFERMPNQYGNQKPLYQNNSDFNNRSAFQNDHNYGNKINNYQNNQEAVNRQMFDAQMNKNRPMQPNNRDLPKKPEPQNFHPSESMTPQNISYDPRSINQYPSSRYPDFGTQNDHISQPRPNPTQYSSNTTDFSGQSNHIHPKTKIANQSFSKSIYENTAIRDIAPPSELPNEAIMTEPPKFADLRTANSSITDRSGFGGNIYDQQRMKYENLMKMQPNYSGDVYGQLPSNQQPFPNEKLMKTEGQNINARICDDYSAADNSQFYPEHNLSKTQPKTKQPTFIPSMTEIDPDPEINCFTNFSVLSRSRSQSNGSVGSLDQSKSSMHPVQSRSRNSSESKDSAAPLHQHSATRPLESTKEETDAAVAASNDKAKPSESSESKSWNIFKMFKPAKQKDIFLPDDSKKTIVYDEVKKEWIDTSSPEEKRSITPPPMLPAFDNNNLMSATDPYQANSLNQFSKSRYRQVAVNVKPSIPATLPLPNPTFNMAQHLENSLNQTVGDGNYSQMYNDYSKSVEYGYSGSDMNNSYFTNYNHLSNPQPISDHMNY